MPTLHVQFPPDLSEYIGREAEARTKRELRPVSKAQIIREAVAAKRADSSARPDDRARGDGR